MAYLKVLFSNIYRETKGKHKIMNRKTAMAWQEFLHYVEFSIRCNNCDPGTHALIILS